MKEAGMHPKVAREAERLQHEAQLAALEQSGGGAGSSRQDQYAESRKVPVRTIKQLKRKLKVRPEVEDSGSWR